MELVSGVQWRIDLLLAVGFVWKAKLVNECIIHHCRWSSELGDHSQLLKAETIAGGSMSLEMEPVIGGRASLWKRSLSLDVKLSQEVIGC